MVTLMSRACVWSCWVLGPRGAVLEEGEEERAPHQLLAVGPDPSKARLLLEEVRAALTAGPVLLLDGLPQLGVGDRPGTGHRFRGRKGEVVAGIPGLLPGVSDEPLARVVRVEPGTEPLDVLLLGDAREAEFPRPRPCQSGMGSPLALHVVIDIREFQVISGTTGRGSDGEHGVAST